MIFSIHEYFVKVNFLMLQTKSIFHKEMNGLWIFLPEYLLFIYIFQRAGQQAGKFRSYKLKVTSQNSEFRWSNYVDQPISQCLVPTIQSSLFLFVFAALVNEAPVFMFVYVFKKAKIVKFVFQYLLLVNESISF